MRFRSRRLLIGVGVTVVALITLFVIFQRSPIAEQTTTDTVTGRAAYAQLYDVFWRSDDGTQPTLVTATLFPPSLVKLLERAGEKTTDEQQLFDIVGGTDSTHMSAYVTIDSISGSASDAQIQSSLSAVLDTQSSISTTWTPIIASSNLINAPAGTSSQKGIAQFRFAQPIDWTKVQKIQIEIHGLPKTGNRTFTWSGAVLQQVTP